MLGQDKREEAYWTVVGLLYAAYICLCIGAGAVVGLLYDILIPGLIVGAVVGLGLGFLTHALFVLRCYYRMMEADHEED